MNHLITSERYINPFTDFGFKKLFGVEANKDLLIDFLNELISEQGKIVDVKYLNPEQLGRNKDDRRAIFDIYCESATGEKFIVEMQKAKHDFFKDRSVFYATFPIREQAKKGDSWNYELKAVYTVGILDFVFNESKKNKVDYQSTVKLMDVCTKEIFYDKLTFIYLEMPKFNKEVEQLTTHFEKWMYVLKNLPRLQERPPQLQERVFKKIFRIAEIAKLDEVEMAEYETNLKVHRDWYSIISSAEREAEEKGREKERKESLKEIAKIHKESQKKIEEERRESQKKIEEERKENLKKLEDVAQKLLNNGMSIAEVCNLTGLTEQQIKESLNP